MGNGNFELLILNFELKKCTVRTGNAYRKQARAKRAPQLKIQNSKFKIQKIQG
jgi:hypothetical protein